MPKPAAARSSIDPDAALALLLRPELALLDHLRPEAAQARRARMAEDAYGFYRGANAIACHWLTGALPADVPWVWAMGDAHPDNFATLAVGPRRGDDGLSPVRVDVADVDDEHPAPWCWDAVRLLAGIRLRLPKLKTLPELAAAHLDEYRRTVADHRAGDVRWTRIDLAGLPVPLQEAISADSAAERYAKHLAEHVDGQRLRRGKRLAACTDGDAVRACVARAWQRPDMPEHEVIDVATRLGGGGVASRGRRRWMLLVRERVRVAGKVEPRLRLVEVKERRPSVLARFVAVDPFPPRDAPPASVPMGLDPFHGVVPAGAGMLMARTRCHARTPLDLGACDDGDLVRAARLFGQLLAAFHCRGLVSIGVERTLLASVGRPDAAQLADWAEGLAAWTTECHARFAKGMKKR